MRRPPKDDDTPATPISRQTLAEALAVLRYIRPYRVKFALGLACLFVGSLFGLGFPYLAGNLVDAVLVGAGDGAREGWLQNVNLVAVGLVVILAFQAGFALLRTVW